MKSSLRQSMAWLHTWAGLLTGWLLYFVFVTGTFGYVNREITRWMQPEEPLAARAPTAPSVLLAAAEARLRSKAGDAERWLIVLPTWRETQFRIEWQNPSKQAGGNGTEVTERLDARTGEPLVVEPRETGGATTLYQMHYNLHYVARDWGRSIVGVATMFMVVAMLSGIVTHKKIFTDFFTFRPAKGQRSWLDAHTLFSVAALPFHLMIAWSGLFFFLFSYMPLALDALYPEGKARDGFNQRAYRYESALEKTLPSSAPLVPLVPLLAQAEREWEAATVGVRNLGRSDAYAYVTGNPPGVPGEERSMSFDGTTGAHIVGQRRTTPARFRQILVDLHQGRFAGPALRLLYVAASFAGTGMIACGLLLWSTTRKEKLARGRPAHLGMAIVDVLNLGTIIGLPIGVAAYFWANRLIPVGIAHRADWEVHTIFIIWGLAFLHTMWRSRQQARAWLELTIAAAIAWGLLPILNTLTTDRHLGITIPAGDWVLASIDLGMLAAGLFFALLARGMWRRQRAGAAGLPQTGGAAVEGVV